MSDPNGPVASGSGEVGEAEGARAATTVQFPSGPAEYPGMVWVVGAVAVWFVLAFVAAVVLGRGVRLADDRAARSVVLTTADLPAGFVPAA